MLINIDRFGSLQPVVSPRLLQNYMGQTASNCKLVSGDLDSWLAPLSVNTPTKTGTKKSIYKWGSSYWFHWITDVDVVRGPVAGDTTERTYFAGGSSFVPQMTYNSIAQTGGTDYPMASYDLGVPAPTTAPTVTVGGTAPGANDTVETRAYVYTYVSALGEEGPPSPVSTTVDVGPAQYVDLSAMLTGPGSGNLNLSTKRIYRAVTGDNGTDYLYVDEIALATTTYHDTVATADLGEAIPSTYWDPPPTDLAGLVSFPGGVLAGFSANELCFSEPYVPSAWPTSYRLTTDHPIVALGVFDNVIVVTTTGTPYLVTGTSPDSMTMVKLSDSGLADNDDPRVLEACVSKRGLVEMGGTVMYPVSSGIVAVSSSGARLISKEIMSIDYWKALVPSSISAYSYNGKYVAFYDTGAGTQAGFLFDPNNPLDPLSFTDQFATAGFLDKSEGNLYLQIGSDIKKWDAGASAMTRTWKSKIFKTNGRDNLACARVRSFTYPITFKLYADQTLKLTLSVTSDDPFWLPAGYLATEWEVQLEGTPKVKSVALASSMAELMQAT